jgi:polysaccharide export outer membrane protein
MRLEKRVASLAFTCLKASFGTVLAMTPALAADKDYRIGVGDTLSLWVAGVPELNMHLPVGMKGGINVPLAGETQAAGLTLTEVQSAVASILSQRMLFQKSTDGRSVGVAIGRDQILVQVEEYRPIYVTGDVSKPGAQTFRPGMTVRQAISVAGGYDLFRSAGSSLPLDVFDLRSQQETLWIEYAQTLANVQRIKAEIDSASSFNVDAVLARVPVAASIRRQIVDTTSKQLEYQIADLQEQKDALAHTSDLVKKGVSVLTDKLDKENEGVAQDESDLVAMKDLYKNNTIPMTRLMDARRMAQISSSRSLQTLSELNQLQRAAYDAEEQPRKLEAQRRILLTNELQEAQDRLASLHSQLDAVADKLLYSSAVKSELSSGLKQTRNASIHRTVDGMPTPVVSDDDTVLTPGDVVEVTFDPHIVAQGAAGDRYSGATGSIQ